MPLRDSGPIPFLIEDAAVGWISDDKGRGTVHVHEPRAGITHVAAEDVSLIRPIAHLYH